MFLISGAAAHLLTSQAYVRIDTALRPRTAKNYLSKFKLYLAFVMWHQLSLDQVDTIPGIFRIPSAKWLQSSHVV